MARNHITPQEVEFVKDIMRGMNHAESWIKNIYPTSGTAEGTQNAGKNANFLYNKKPAVIEFKERLLKKLDDEVTDVIGSLVSQLNALERLAETAEEGGELVPAINARKELVRFREGSNMRKLQELKALSDLAEKSNIPQETVSKLASDIARGPVL